MRRLIALAGLALVLSACDGEQGNAPAEAGSANVPANPEAEPEAGEKEEPAPKPTIEPQEGAEGGGEGGDAGGGLETSERIVVGEDPCKTDADCVPATCCHPNACVSADKKPDCKDATCTLNCQGDTMDCGGGCLCQEGKCAAKLVTMGSPSPG